MAATYSSPSGGYATFSENDAYSERRSEPIDERSARMTDCDPRPTCPTPLLTSDFYSFQDLLTPDENAHVMEHPGVPRARGAPDRRRLLGPRRVPDAPHPRVGRARHARAGVAGDRAVREHRALPRLGRARDRRASTPASRRSSACRTAWRWARSASAAPPSSAPSGSRRWPRGEMIGALRAHRAAVRLRHRPRPAHDRAPHRRHVGAQRRQALDRQRDVRGRRRHLGARHRRRPGQGLPRPPRHPRVHRDEDRAQAGAAHRPERRHPARRRRGARGATGCRTSTRSATSRSCCA